MSELRCPTCQQLLDIPSLVAEPDRYTDKVLLMMATYVPGRGWIAATSVIDPEGELTDAPLDFMVSAAARESMRALQATVREENPE